MSNRKEIAYLFGKWGEDAACLFLRLKGYRLIKRNYRSPVGEIDIIAQKRNIVCFIEVKSRHKRMIALNALSNWQQKRIVKAAQVFLKAHPQFQQMDYRFDLIALSRDKLPLHLKNAWFDTS